MDLYENIREQVRAAKHSSGMTWREIADESGLHQGTILKFMNRQRVSMRPEYLERLCRTLGLTFRVEVRERRRWE